MFTIMMPLQSPEGGGAGGVLGGILLSVGQANGILAAGLTALATYRAIREAWKAAHPSEQSPFQEDVALIEMLRTDAAKGVAEVDALLAKYGATA